LQNRLKLRGGEILSIRVNQDLGKNRYSVTIRGNVFPIRANVALPVGGILRAKVIITGTRIELKILAPGRPAETGTALPSVANPAYSPAGLSVEASMVLLQAMRRSGLPTTPEAMAAINAMIPPSRRKDAGFVRFATILHDKHLHVDPERLEELYLSISGKTEREPTPGGGHGRRGGSGRESDKEPSNPSRSEDGAEVAEVAKAGEASEASGGRRRWLEEHVRAGLAAGEDSDWRAVLNHRTGAHGSWVIVPFSMEGDDASLTGSLRLLVDTSAPGVGGRLRVTRASIVVAGLCAFEVTGAPPDRLAIHADSTVIQSRIDGLLPELAEKLRNLGVEIDDTNIGGTVFDGFTAETTEIRGVDATA